MVAFPFRDFLRRETGALHRRVDDAFSRFDLSVERGVQDFLTAQAAALLPIERAVERCREGGAGALIPDWASRRRSFLLQGLDLDVPSLSIEPCGSKEAMLGMLYVLEGSKLGGRVLSERLVELEEPFGRAAALFLGHGAARGRWSSFLAVLERHAPQPYGQVALGGATAAFEIFETAAVIVAGRRDEEHGTPRRRSAVSVPRGGDAPSSPALEPRAPLDRHMGSIRG